MIDSDNNKRQDSYNSQDDLEKLYLTEKKNPSVVSYNLSSDIEQHNFIIVTKQEKLLERRHSKDYYQNYEKTFKYCTLLRVLNALSLFILIDTVIFFSIYSFVSNVVFFREFLLTENDNITLFQINSILFYFGWTVIIGNIICYFN